MKPSANQEPVVDVIEELVKSTVPTRDRSEYLVDRYSERVAEGRLPHAAEHVADAMDHELQDARLAPGAGSMMQLGCTHDWSGRDKGKGN